MKKIYLAAVLTTLFIGSQAQNFNWAKDEGLYAYDYGYGIATDNAGNVYVAGKYEQAANFSGTILPCTGTPDCNHDIWVAQYSSSGALNWIHTGGGNLGDYAHSLACDGNFVYIAGEIEGANNLITFPGSTVTLTAIGSNDAFLAKYDLSGNLLWARSAGGTDNDKALGVTYDNAGNVFISGFFTNSATFGGSTTINGTGGEDIFVAKYDANGNFQWVKQGGSSQTEEAKGIKCDPAGNVYVCGKFYDGAVFDSQTLHTYNMTTGYSDLFLACYSNSGTLSWIKTGGGDYDDVAWSITMDNTGKIYIAGEFNAYAVFGSTALVSGGSADIIVACYDASGNSIWAKQAGGPWYDLARGIGTDGTNIFITGQFGSTANFGSQALTAVDTADIFFASLNNTGAFIGAASVGGTPDTHDSLGYESGITICAEPSGNVYASGALLNGGTFGSTTLTTYGRTDVFITKITQLMSGIDSYAFNEGTISSYPNPSSGHFIIDLNKALNQRTETTIYNSLGTTVAKRTDASVSKMQLDLSGQESGVYYIEMKTEDQKVIREKLVIQK
jgi:hypothetical protein